MSDAREPLLLTSTAHHQRLPSDASELLSDTGSDLVPNFGTYAKLENQDDVSLLGAGKACFYCIDETISAKKMYQYLIDYVCVARHCISCFASHDL